MITPDGRLMRWKTRFFSIWAVIGGLLLAAAALVGLGRISGALAPFILAFLVVFLLQGVVTALEKRGVARTPAVIVCFIAGFVAVSVIFVFLVPPVVAQIVEFAKATPSYIDSARQLVVDLNKQYHELIPAWLQEAVDSVSGSVSELFINIGNRLGRGLLSAGSSIATIILDLFLGAVIAFWTLKDLPKIRDELRVLAGDKYEDDLENLLGTVGRVVGGYLKGQTIASLATGAIAGIGLAIIGVPYALVLGILTFVFNYVPYVGPVLAGLIAAAAALFVGFPQAVASVVIVVAAQQLTDLFITPRVMSEQVDLHPILVIFSLLVGGSLFGFWGMIFGIPVAATAKGLFVYYWEARNQRALATEDGALFRSSGCEDDETDEPCEPDSSEAESGTHQTPPKGSE